GADPVDERDQQGQLSADRAAVAAQPFDHRRFGLRDQRHRLGHHDDCEHHQYGEQKQPGSCTLHGILLKLSEDYGVQTTAVAPSICMTVTRSPGSNTSPSFNGLAVHTWPSNFTCPSSRATRSRT